MLEYKDIKIWICKNANKIAMFFVWNPGEIMNLKAEGGTNIRAALMAGL